jgi:LPPG:FO 2-phospho-L-lactate transferase
MNPDLPRVTALAGGVGAARMLRGLAAVVGQANLTAVVNTGDDMVLHGLYVSPDIDTVTYTLGGAANDETGWGLEKETWAVMDALRAFEPAQGVATASLTWFNLGDRDLATHLFRTGRLAGGATLSQVTAEVAGRFGVQARLLPMTDSRVETRVTVQLGQLKRNFGGLGAVEPHEGDERQEGDERDELAGKAEMGSGLVEIGFQEYFVGFRHGIEVKRIRFAGAEVARPAPGVLAAIAGAEVLVICPSNPIVSIGPVMAVPGIADAVAERRADVVAVSPIIAGRALKGPADRMLGELGYEASAVGVARLWAHLAATLVVDEQDAALAPQVEAEGMRCMIAPSIMSGPREAANLARAVLGETGPAKRAPAKTGPAKTAAAETGPAKTAAAETAPGANVPR